jgi:hypothetical protein
MSAGPAWLNVAAFLQDQGGAIHALRGRRAGGDDPQGVRAGGARRKIGDGRLVQAKRDLLLLEIAL